MTVVYIDSVFFLNTLVDYLLLLTTASLSGTPLRRIRFALMAALGGGYAVSTFLLPPLSAPLLRVVCGAVMATVAFWHEARSWRMVALFFLLSGALAGILLALGLAAGSPKGIIQRLYYADISWGVLLGAAVAFYGLLHLLFRQGARYGGGDFVDVTVTIRGRRCRLRALRDSGNTLRDPIQGRPVLVADVAALTPLWDKETQAILQSQQSAEQKMMQLCEKGNSFTLLPYKSVSECEGLLLAVRSDHLQIGRRIVPRVLVALTNTPIGSGCHALWGGNERGEGGLHHESTAEDHSMAPTADRAG